jgi:hypothetical protein
MVAARLFEESFFHLTVLLIFLSDFNRHKIIIRRKQDLPCLNGFFVILGGNFAQFLKFKNSFHIFYGFFACGCRCYAQ